MTIPIQAKDSVNVCITCHGWDTELQDDSLMPHIQVGICLPIAGNAGRSFNKQCNTPQELWDYFQQLTEDPVTTLQTEFAYTGPVKDKKRTAIPIDLKSLFD